MSRDNPRAAKTKEAKLPEVLLPCSNSGYTTYPCMHFNDNRRNEIKRLLTTVVACSVDSRVGHLCCEANTIRTASQYTVIVSMH